MFKLNKRGSSQHLLPLTKIFLVLLLTLLLYQTLPLSLTGQTISKSLPGTKFHLFSCKGTPYTQGSCSLGNICTPSGSCVSQHTTLDKSCSTNSECYSTNCDPLQHLCKQGSKTLGQVCTYETLSDECSQTTHSHRTCRKGISLETSKTSLRCRTS